MMEQIKDTDAFMQRFQQLLLQGETLMLPVLGQSMSPFLVHQRDTVWLKAAADPLKVGDLVLYRRENGAYILHRICRITGSSYMMIGDAHTVAEPNIRREQILAVAVRALCSGKIQEPGTFRWEFFCRVWIRLIPLRPFLIRIYTTLKKPFRRNL